MANAMALYDSVLSSNLPVQEKSQLRRFFEKMTDSPLALRPTGRHAHGAMSAVRQGSEALVTGMGLGAIHVMAKNGLDVGGVPIDGAGGFALLAASAFAANSDMAPDARNIGSTGVGIFGFRATTEFLVQKRLSKGLAIPSHLSHTSKIAGENDGPASVENDPIVRAAKNV